MKDPANPDGNDLSDALNDTTKTLLSAAARNSLARIEGGGWESLGRIEEATEVEKREAIQRAPSIITVRANPLDAPASV